MAKGKPEHTVSSATERGAFADAPHNETHVGKSMAPLSWMSLLVAYVLLVVFAFA
ncbi:MAG: hypothetical protein O2912_08280 [Proteobacteria bacterium]|nr:hypothetical protein [Pseudomonadota bacterium]